MRVSCYNTEEHPIGKVTVNAPTAIRNLTLEEQKCVSEVLLCRLDDWEVWGGAVCK